MIELELADLLDASGEIRRIEIDAGARDSGLPSSVCHALFL
jgi:hypothetical protein